MASSANANSGHSGHGPYPPASMSSPAASNVYINGQLAGSVGDVYDNHDKGGGTPNPHPDICSGGSASVNVQGAAAARVGDPCSGSGTSTIISGSGNVFIGG